MRPHFALSEPIATRRRLNTPEGVRSVAVLTGCRTPLNVDANPAGIGGRSAVKCE